ncbi:unnamed protein product [Polarella glacialis]|uniref:Uncharacterized protein n=1 Tax=Polarella glacialis TaxID=89957 RepID=A0A813KZK6_POLGL|nr:unnamed protein product [Polarella glacialis]
MIAMEPALLQLMRRSTADQQKKMQLAHVSRVLGCTARHRSRQLSAFNCKSGYTARVKVVQMVLKIDDSGTYCCGLLSTAELRASARRQTRKGGFTDPLTRRELV